MSNEQFVVNGRIADSLNVPLKGIRVVSFDKDLRREEQLGDQVTDNNGYYEIRYLSQQFSHAEKESPDLFFKLFASTGEELTNFTATVKLGSPITMLNISHEYDSELIRSRRF